MSEGLHSGGRCCVLLSREMWGHCSCLSTVALFEILKLTAFPATYLPERFQIGSQKGCLRELGVEPGAERGAIS